MRRHRLNRLAHALCGVDAIEDIDDFVEGMSQSWVAPRIVVATSGDSGILSFAADEPVVFGIPRL